MLKSGVSPVCHYLDDFWTCGAPEPSNQCQLHLTKMLRTCDELGFSVNPKKTTSPCTKLELLGIELDTVTQQAQISVARSNDIIDLLSVVQ